MPLYLGETGLKIGRRIRVWGDTAVGGLTPTTFATTPTVQYHPHSQSGSVTKSGSRITACPDLSGFAALTAGSSTGPLEMTDALGRKFWRFNGDAYATIANALVHDARNISVFMVARVHKHSKGYNFLGQGSVDNATTPGTNPLGAIMSTSVSSSIAPTLRVGNVNANTDATNKAKMIPGCQLHVMGAVSRTTANGASLAYINNDRASMAQTGNSGTGYVGAEIGRYPFAPGASGLWAGMDLYELAIFVGSPTNTQADAYAAALVSNYSIPAVTNQLITEGDSITDGINEVLSGDNMGMVLGAPGVCPSGWRIVNVGSSGATAATLLARRDATNSAFTCLLSGQNRLAVQIGRNDLAASRTGSQVVADLVALWNTTTTGYLQRGFTGWQVINMANGGLATEYGNLRTGLRAAQFLIDTGTNSGGAFDGKMSRIELPLITDGGTLRFSAPTDASNTTYYQSGDTTHPSIYGTKVLALGGDTPQYGYRSALT